MKLELLKHWQIMPKEFTSLKIQKHSKSNYWYAELTWSLQIEVFATEVSRSDLICFPAICHLILRIPWAASSVLLCLLIFLWNGMKQEHLLLPGTSQRHRYPAKDKTSLKYTSLKNRSLPFRVHGVKQQQPTMDIRHIIQFVRDIRSARGELRLTDNIHVKSIIIP